MNPLGRVQEKRRRAGRGHGGGDLLANQAGLAHAGDHEAAAALEDHLGGRFEIAVEPLEKIENGLRLYFQYFFRIFEHHR